MTLFFFTPQQNLLYHRELPPIISADESGRFVTTLHGCSSTFLPALIVCLWPVCHSSQLCELVSYREKPRQAIDFHAFLFCFFALTQDYMLLLFRLLPGKGGD